MEKNLYRLCILQQPFTDDETLVAYLEIENSFKIHSFIEKLIENRVFYHIKG